MSVPCQKCFTAGLALWLALAAGIALWLKQVPSLSVIPDREIKVVTSGLVVYLLELKCEPTNSHILSIATKSTGSIPITNILVSTTDNICMEGFDLNQILPEAKCAIKEKHISGRGPCVCRLFLC